MKIDGGGSAPQFLQTDAVLYERIAARLRAIEASTGHRLVVIRDPATQRFVVQVLDDVTRTVIDQFPVENLLKNKVREGL